MRRLVIPAVLTGLAVVGCTQPTGTTTGGTKNYKITLDSDTLRLNADMTSAATLTATVSGGRPETSVRFEADFGQFEGGDAVDDFKSIVVGIPEGSGRITAQVRCIKIANGNNVPHAGTLRVKAILRKNESDVPEDKESNRVDIRCEEVQDNSSLSFDTPLFGTTVQGGTAQEVTIVVKDFNGEPAADTVRPVEVRGLATTGIALTNDGSNLTRGPNRILQVPVMAGVARFFVMYPGDEATNAGPLTLDLHAEWKSTLGKPNSADHTFNYKQAPNNSSIRFVKAQVQGEAMPRLETPPFVVLAAGAGGSSVDLTVEVRDRDGNPVPPGTQVVFSCIPSTQGDSAGALACASLTGLPPDMPTTPVPNLTRAVALTTTESMPVTRSVATITFDPQDSTQPTEVTIEAAFTLPNSDQQVSTGEERARIRLVDSNTISLNVTVTNATIRSDSGATGKLVFSANRGVAPYANGLLCVRLDASSSSRAVLRDLADDNDTTAVVLPTNAEGKAEVIVAPSAPNVRGPVLVSYTLVDVPYAATLDDNAATPQATACEVAAANATSRYDGTEQLQITREPILGALRFISATPSLIGTRGSSALPTNSTVVFQVFNDENAPIGAGQAVEFELDNNVDANASVTPLALTDDQGLVQASVTSGNQAASLVVRARAVRLGTVITASSDPISVIGGRPAWANSVLTAESYHTFGGPAVLGVRDIFEPTLEPASIGVHFSLVDRFSNRVQRDTGGYQVQWRAEGGNVPASALANDNGTSVVPYKPGGTFAQDLLPNVDEQRVVVPFVRLRDEAPQDTMRVANPRDGRVTIMAAVRGEESFIDNNGDGAFQRPYADTNNNNKYDGPAENCQPCGTAVCTKIAEVSDPNRRDFNNNRDLVESFVDLPEPFVDGNEDFIRSNCDLPEFMLPVHHNLAMKAAGIGTYCNPDRDDEALDDQLIATNPETLQPFTAAECRQHWCPEWDPQWNCRDTAPPNGVYGPNASAWAPEWDKFYDSDLQHHKTWEAVETAGKITGGRIVWCPDWRYVDFEFVGGAGRDPGRQTVGMQGVMGIVLDDQTPPGDGTLSMTGDPIGEITFTVSGSTGTFTYRAPGEATAGGGVQVNLTTEQNINHIRLTSSGGTRRAYVKYDPRRLPRTTRTIQFRVRRGALPAPVSENMRNYLRFTYTEQFIDGNNNGKFDEANGCYDTDTLIWKNAYLSANADLRFSTDDISAQPATLPNTAGTPVVQGVRNLATPPQLCLSHDGLACTEYGDEPMQSFFHVVPGHANEQVSATIHNGSADNFYIDLTHPVATLYFKFRDVNGQPVNAYDYGLVGVDCQSTAPLLMSLVGDVSYDVETGTGTVTIIPLLAVVPQSIIGGACTVTFQYTRGTFPDGQPPETNQTVKMTIAGGVDFRP